MSLRLIADATEEPVTLAQARRHLRIDADTTAEDSDITEMIVAARRQAEHETGRALTTQTWERVLDRFPPAEIELGMPSVIDVVSITYVDTAGLQQTLASSAYVLDRDTDPGYVLPADGTSWPDTYPDTTNAVRVRFRAGYLADADKDRAMLRRWMLLQIGSLYEHRKSVHTGPGVADLPNRFVDRLLDPYRFYAP